MAQAECFGSGSVQTCTDGGGNSYVVNRFGNSTFLNGTNSATGSIWSQDSITTGDMTMHSGRAANGNAWSMTEQSVGDTSIFSGTDGSGNSFTTVCGIFGCY